MTPATAAFLTVLAVAAYGALHSALATLWMKGRAHRWLGPTADRFYRLGYNAIGAVTFLPVLAIPALEPGPTLYLVPVPLAWLFVAGQAAAVALVMIGILQTDAWHFLGLRQLIEPQDDQPAQFVTSGLYRYVRHPLYAAGLLFLWLTPLMTTSMLALIAGLSVYLYVGSLFEERRLEAEFGDAYAAYRRRVPRLIPRLRPVPPPPAGGP